MVVSVRMRSRTSTLPLARVAIAAQACLLLVGCLPEPEGSPPPLISDVTCRAKPTKVDVTWTDQGGFVFYRVLRSEGAGPPHLVAEVEGGVFADMGLTDGITYSYRVRGVSPGGAESGDSNACAATPLPRLLPPGANQPPEITSQPLASARVGEAYAYDVLAIDPDGDALAFSLDVGPAGMAIDATSGRVEWIPAASQSGPQFASVRAADPGGLFALQSFVVDVSEQASNEPPRITSQPPLEAVEDTPYAYDADATDPEGGPLEWALLEGPAGMTIDPLTGLVAWTPPPGSAGDHPVRVEVTDSAGASAEQAYLLAVAAPTAGVESLLIAPNPAYLSDDPVQLTVSANLVGGAQQDVTSGGSNGPTSYVATPAGIVSVGANGLVTPLADGSANVHVEHGGRVADATVHVLRGLVALAIVNVPTPRVERSASGLLGESRAGHTATLLDSGEVLVTGGYDENTSNTALPRDSAEVFDPASGDWRPVGAMSVRRFAHEAVPLLDGRVLVFGGQGGPITTSADVYDPASESFSPVGPMGVPRAFADAVRLLDGRVLVAGGLDSTSGTLSSRIERSAEIFDPATDTWSPAADMNAQRQLHTLTLLSDGRVLAVGGFGFDSEVDQDTLRSAEVYDPASDQWSPTGPLAVSRDQHAALRLEGGDVLVCGGFGQDPTRGSSAMNRCERYDPSAGSWSDAQPMRTHRHSHTLSPLPGGRVLALGGRDVIAGGVLGVFEALFAAEIYDPVRDLWFRAPPLADGRHRHAATVLPDGRVLVSGGEEGIQSGSTTHPTRITNEIYTPAADLPSLPLPADEVEQLIVQAILSDGSTRDVSHVSSRIRYEVDDAGIVEVGESGQLTPNAPGTATVTARWGPVATAVEVNVLPVVPVLERIEALPLEVELGTDLLSTRQLVVNGQLSDGSDVDLASAASGTSYLTTDPAVATADPDGLVMSVAAGSTTLYARNGERSSGVHVQVGATSLLSLAVEPPLLETEVGEDTQLAVTGRFSVAGIGIVEVDLSAAATGTTYFSSDTGVLSVDAEGLATGVGNGAATVTVRNAAFDRVRTASVDVLVGPTTITGFTGGLTSVGQAGGPLRLSVSLVGFGFFAGIAVEVEVSGPGGYAFSGAGIADANGRVLIDLPVTTVAGEYTATASALNPADGTTVTGDVVFDVNPGPIAGLALSLDSHDLLEGGAVLATVTGEDAYGNFIERIRPTAVTTDAADASIREVSNFPSYRYEVGFPSQGLFEITARVGNSNPILAVQSVSVVGLMRLAFAPAGPIRLPVGETLDPAVIAFAQIGLRRDVSADPATVYASSDAGVASVAAGGHIEALAPGVATIEVSYDGLLASVEVLVPDAAPTAALSGIDLLPPASPIAAGTSPLAVTAQLAGTGSLAGLSVVFETEGLPDRDAVVAVSDATGLATARLEGLVRPGSGAIRASVVDPDGGATLQDSEPLSIEAGPLARVLLRLDATTIPAGGSVQAQAEAVDRFGNPLPATPIALGSSAADAGIDDSSLPATISFPTAGVHDVTATAGGITRARRVIVRAAPDDVVLAELSPSPGFPGAVVQLLGAGFSAVPAENQVELGGTPLEVIAASPSRLTVQLPEGLAGGPVTVTVNGAASNAFDYAVEATSPFAGLITDDELALGLHAGQVLYFFANGRPTPAELDALAADFGLVRQLVYPELSAAIGFLADATISRSFAVAAALAADPRVLLAVPGHMGRALVHDAFDDPDYSLQRQLFSTNLAVGLRTIFPLQGEGVTIGFLDSGLGGQNLTSEFEGARREVQLSMATGRLPEDMLSVADGIPDGGHGTLVVATATGRADNGLDGVGVAPRAEVVSLRVLDGGRCVSRATDGRCLAVGDAGGYEFVDLLTGLRRLSIEGVDVVNMSIGTTIALGDADLRDDLMGLYALAIDTAIEARGFEPPPIFVAAAGNEREDLFLDSRVGLPAADPRVIAVGALDEPDEDSPYLGRHQVALYSNTGAEIDYLAPGVANTSGVGGPLFGIAGTSFASPMVAGLVALIQAEEGADPASRLSLLGVHNRLLERFTFDLSDPAEHCAPGTSDLLCNAMLRPGWDRISGYGAIHVYGLFGVGDGQVWRFDPLGRAESIAAGLTFPTAVATSTSGDVYVVDTDGPGMSGARIVRVAADGSVTTVVPDGTLGLPISIDVDRDGRIAVLDRDPARTSSATTPLGAPRGYQQLVVFHADGSVLWDVDLPAVPPPFPPEVAANGVVYDEEVVTFQALAFDRASALQRLVLSADVVAFLAGNLAADSVGGALYEFDPSSGALSLLVSGFPDLGLSPLLVQPVKLGVDEGGRILYQNLPDRFAGFTTLFPAEVGLHGFDGSDDAFLRAQPVFFDPNEDTLSFLFGVGPLGNVFSGKRGFLDYTLPVSLDVYRDLSDPTSCVIENPGLVDIDFLRD